MMRVLSLLFGCAFLSPWLETQGAPTTPAHGCGSNPADIMFLLDSSGSVGMSNYQKQKDFVARFAQAFDIGPNATQIGVVTFATSVKNEFDMNRFHDKASLLNAIHNIPYVSGITNTDQAILYIMNHSFTKPAGERDHVPNILIVMTDGQSSNPALTKVAAAKLHQTNIKSFAIGIGSGISQTELQLIASDHQHVFTVDNFNALSTLNAELKKTACEGSGTGCAYNGQMYQQSQTWKDSCKYRCTCIDAKSGQYTCQGICLQWNLPSGCTLDPPAAGKCCETPKCPAGFTINYPPGYIQE